MSHGDFYFAVNATFYHFSDLGGDEALIAYWKALGREYLRPLAERFRAGGLAEIKTYYQDYFAAEPGGDVTVKRTDAATVILDVRECPAIAWLRNSKASGTHPPVHPMYCQHCPSTAPCSKRAPSSSDLKGATEAVDSFSACGRSK